jgi:hypothetical protein
MTTLKDWLPPDERYCLFCGAGFSKWAVGLPTTYELFDFKIKTYGSREESKLKQLQELKMKWDIKNPSNNAEEFIGDLIAHSLKYKKLVIWYIVRRLAEPFVEKVHYTNIHFPEVRGRRVMGIDDRTKVKIPGIKKAANFIKPLTGPNFEGIITTNYDLLIEYALGTKLFFYGSRPRWLYGPPRAYSLPRDRMSTVYLKGSIPLVKIHGSISLTEKGYCADARGSITGKAIIAPPAHDKKIATLLTQEWKYAQKILKNSKKIIFFGFRFNDYDQELIDLFKETAPSIKEIILININSDVKSMAQKIWPFAKIILIHPSELSEMDLPSII